jgi:pyruvate/2-oxoglutarate dehydrogenase complex dihydrolipoamide acyltransferase (E2) component
LQQGDNSKGVQVGVRIAVTAEPGDDLSTLEIPEADKPAKQAEAPKKTEESKPIPKEERTTSAPPPKASSAPGGKAKKQTYPLYPSVQHLLKLHGLPKEEADKIPASGPNGRLLKGDVLAYVGKIQGAYPSELAARFKTLSHLDLSNIKVAPKKEAAPKPAAPVPQAVPELPVEIALPISLKAVTECQQRVKDSIGVFLPLSTFIARAAELANEDLPKSKTAKPSADELFNAVLGLNKVAKVSRGNFVPQVTSLPAATLTSTRPAFKKPDVLDILSGKPLKRTKAPVVGGADVVVGPLNVFSVSVPKGDEKRGRVFLERVKTVLEAEPGRLVV